MCSRPQVDERISLRGFREYLTNGSEVCQIPPAAASLQNTVKLIPISSSEAEREFSQMNLIVTPTRASLATTTVSSLLSIRLAGPPLHKFNPANYITSWIAKDQHFTDDTNSKKCKRDSVDATNMEIIWKLL